MIAIRTEVDVTSSVCSEINHWSGESKDQQVRRISIKQLMIDMGAFEENFQTLGNPGQIIFVGTLYTWWTVLEGVLGCSMANLFQEKTR